MGVIPPTGATQSDSLNTILNVIGKQAVAQIDFFSALTKAHRYNALV
jgi:hypothetical protein